MCWALDNRKGVGPTIESGTLLRTLNSVRNACRKTGNNAESFIYDEIEGEAGGIEGNQVE